MARLPVPEPFKFSRDPLRFVEWSTGFEALIKTSCSGLFHKLLYLKQSISGGAVNVLEVAFYRRDEEAYKQDWDALNKCHGDLSVVQKSSSWPKIRQKKFTQIENVLISSFPAKMLCCMCKASKWKMIARKIRRYNWNVLTGQQHAGTVRSKRAEHAIRFLPFALKNNIGKVWKGIKAGVLLTSANVSKIQKPQLQCRATRFSNPNFLELRTKGTLISSAVSNVILSINVTRL